MRKQAEQLVVGRVYADFDEDTTFLRIIKHNENGSLLLSCVGGRLWYNVNEKGLIEFPKNAQLYELTPEEDAIYNKPSDPTFTLSDIQRVIERIEREELEGDALTEHGLRVAIDIMREELKIK